MRLSLRVLASSGYFSCGALARDQREGQVAGGLLCGDVGGQVSIVSLAAASPSRKEAFTVKNWAGVQNSEASSVDLADLRVQRRQQRHRG